MKLFPQDLGHKRGRILLLKRAGLPARLAAESRVDRDEPEKQGEERSGIGFWGRRWLPKEMQRSTKMAASETESPIADEAALAAMHSLRYRLHAWSLLGAIPTGISLIAFLAESSHGNPGAVLPFVAGASLFSFFCAVGRPRALLAGRLRQMREKPLSASEIASLLPLASDELERSYLTLVMDVSRQEVAAQAAGGSGVEAGARTDLREALQALGDAIDRLPTGRTVGGLGSERTDIITEVLRQTAEATLKAAQAEPDRVVAASLVRQVEALHRRADATARADILVRRLSALRQEMAAETEALRAGLAAYYTGAGDVADLTRLVQSVRQVAREASSVTEAVEEVDALTGDSVVSAAEWSPRYPKPVSTDAAESPQIHLGRP